MGASAVLAKRVSAQSPLKARPGQVGNRRSNFTKRSKQQLDSKHLSRITEIITVKHLLVSYQTTMLRVLLNNRRIIKLIQFTKVVEIKQLII